jgi:hypothetical protein
MQIKITDITPFMRKGWTYMDSNGVWCWADTKPILCTQDKNENKGYWYANTIYEYRLNAFDIAPVGDWTKSLIKVGGK